MTKVGPSDAAIHSNTANRMESTSLLSDETKYHPDSSTRYLAYLSRVRTLFTASRHLAYTSDLGEAFRPILSPLLVKAAYGVSFVYVGVDVLLEGIHAHSAVHKPEWTARVMSERAVFQGLASLAVPAFTIHSAVHATQSLMERSIKDFKTRPVLRWGPSMVGLAVIPFLPFVDEPIEYAVEHVFARIWPTSIITNHPKKDH